MINLFGKSKKADEQKESREQKLRDFRDFFPSIKRPNNDDTLYELAFIANEQSHTLRIFIQAEFPSCKPVIQVNGSLSHPWLDQYKRVTGCEKLNNWLRSSSLVDVVTTVVEALKAPVYTPQAAAGNMVGVLNPSPHFPQPSPYTGKQIFAGPPGAFSGHSPVASQPPLPPSQHPFTVGPSPYTYTGTQQYQAIPTWRDVESSENPPSLYSAATFTASPPVAQSLPPSYSHAVSTSTDLYPMSTTTDSLRLNTPSALTSASIPSHTYGDSMGSAKSGSFKSSSSIAPADAIQMPHIPKSFPELRTYTEADLEAIISDPTKIDMLLQAIPAVEGMATKLDAVNESNTQQAQRTVDLHACALALSSEVQEMQAQLRREADVYTSRLKEHSSRYNRSREDVVRQLNARKHALDTASEEVAVKFATGRSDVGAFLEEFLESRKKYHELCGKHKQAQ